VKTKKIQLVDRLLGCLLLLGSLAFGNGFAQLARVPPIKSFYQRFGEGGMLRVTDSHADPGH